MAGAATAKLLTEQLSHWRFSQLQPIWLAAHTTQRLYQHISQQLLPVLQGSDGATSASTSSSMNWSRALDACASQLALVARLVALSEQQMVPQLAGDVVLACRWVLKLLFKL